LHKLFLNEQNKPFISCLDWPQKKAE